MTLRLAPGTGWADTLRQAVALTPEAFGPDRLRNLVEGAWQDSGTPSPLRTPVDGTVLTQLPRLDAEKANLAVRFAADEHRIWAATPLDERVVRVNAALDALTRARDLLALLLVWEIGKPWRLACADVDRALDGVRWYVAQIGRQVAHRDPLPGPVSNIASWNYPMSVLVHAELVQLLAGNAVIAKTPSQGGAVCLTVAHALMRRAGLPVTLLSGSGEELSEVLVRAPEIGAVAFVGGRSNGGKVAAALLDTDKRHMIEQEGLNAWGVWEFSRWDLLGAHLKKGFEYGKQRCTAYPRFVVQRDLVDKFLDVYLPMVKSIRFGHPLAVADTGEPTTDAGPDLTSLPELDFGPLISSAKADELRRKVEEAIRAGAIPLYRGELTDAAGFLAGQDTSAYVAPVALLAPPGRSRLMHAEPFGPVDTIVVVDTEDELLAQMNASNGALVASLACDNEELAGKLARDLQAFKVGINKPRSRGDREEPFGGRGASWKGAFVGGDLLVHAVTVGDQDERLYGNFPEYNRYPTT
jgi:acyl-CoA reductase-like NAD-dependent aldehyde dehydrogenase